MAISDEKVTEKTATETPKPIPAAATTVTNEPRNFLAAFLLTMVAGPLGLRHFYLGNKKLGWVRTGLFAGGYLWFFAMSLLNMPLLAVLGFFAIATASIWAVVDFFYVYSAVKTDAEGQPLTATARDRKWAKIFYFAAIAAFVVGLIVSVVGAALIQNQLKDVDWSNTNSQDYNTSPLPDETFEDYMRRQMQDQQSDTQSF